MEGFFTSWIHQKGIDVEHGAAPPPRAPPVLARREERGRLRPCHNFWSRSSFVDSSLGLRNLRCGAPSEAAELSCAPETRLDKTSHLVENVLAKDDGTASKGGGGGRASPFLSASRLLSILLCFTHVPTSPFHTLSIYPSVSLPSIHLQSD